MKPSDIHISSGPLPLTATFNKAEAEQAAGVMIAIMAGTGDEWRAISVQEMRVHLTTDSRLTGLARNPFYRPTPNELVSRGFAVWTDGCVGFTPEGLDALRGSQWNRGGSNG